MQVFISQIIELFGLNYQPLTFGDLIVWFVCVMSAVCMVAGVVKLMLYISVNIGRIGR